MAQPTECTGSTIVNFLFLAVLRGSTPLMMHFAVSTLNSAGLVVALKCLITLALFIISILWVGLTDVDVRSHIVRNLREKHTYLWLAVVGLFQGAAPYILAVYSLQYLPPMMLGVFMAATPWFAVLFERLPFVKLRLNIPGIIVLGMTIGAMGILLIMAPIVHMSANECYRTSIYPTSNTTNKTPVFTLSPAEPIRTYKTIYDTCLEPADLTWALLALLFASILWGVSSVFWRIKGTKVHHMLFSCGQNLFAGIIAALFWVLIERSHNVGGTEWNQNKAVIGVVFLGVGTGWIATLLVRYLFLTVGAKTTNQVLTAIPFIVFLEDCIFVKDVVTLHPWALALEILGLLLVTVGVFLTSLPREEEHRDRTDSSLSEQLLANEHPSAGVEAGLQQALLQESQKYDPLPDSDDELPPEGEVEINTDETDMFPHNMTSSS